jgi:molybdopterin molybdotransferase
MLTPSDALRQILGRVTPLGRIETVALDSAVGRVLSGEIRSDVDLPPFDKSAMDGFAVHAADLEPALAPGGERVLVVAGESRAGAPYDGSVPPGACVAIYTGAEVPRDCDAVVIVEQSRPVEGGRVVLRDRPAKLQNICNRGMDVTEGAAVLSAGRRIRAVDLALLAAVGAEPVSVVARPRVAILTSGDELVAPHEKPGRGEIREGNTLHLAAMARAAGAEIVRRAVVRDDLDVLAQAFAAALEDCDALVTTGGVSMGKYDLVGAALERCGVEGVFHRVAIKPGKPLWFGARGAVPVFALPGNPVSCLVNHELFVAPALRKLGGEPDDALVPRQRFGRWSGGAREPNPREQYLPVVVRADRDGLDRLEPVRWNGSADVAGISRCEALAVVPPDTRLAGGDLLAWRPMT